MAARPSIFRFTLLAFLLAAANAAAAQGTDDAAARQNRLQQDLAVLKATEELRDKQTAFEHDLAALKDADKALADALNTRIGDINNRIGDISLIAALLALFLAAAGVFGAISTVQRATREAREAANEAAKAWIKDNEQQLRQEMGDLRERLRQELEQLRLEVRKLADQAKLEIGTKVREVEDAKNRLQEALASGQRPEPTASEREALQAVLKGKAERDYTVKDWEDRAFAAYAEGKPALAAEYFDQAAQSPDASQAQITQFLFNRGVLLGELGRGEEAIKAYDEVLSRFGDAREPALREQVAKALFNKGNTLGELGRGEEAIKAYDEVLSRFGDAHEPALREQVAKALFNKGVRLGELGRGEEAIKAYDDVLSRFRDAPEPALREQVAKALFNKGVSLGQLGRRQEEIKAYDELLSRFRDAPEPALREPVAGALNSKGFAQLIKAKNGWNEQEARTALLHQSLDCFNRALADTSDKSIVLGNRGYAMFLLGQREEARQSLREALEQGGERLRDAELEDSNIAPVPEDDAFRALIAELWAEIQDKRPGSDGKDA